MKFYSSQIKECKQCQAKFKVWTARVNAGKGKFCSRNCYNLWQKNNSWLSTNKNPSKTPEGKARLKLQQKGDKCWNWKGGITPEIIKIRNSTETVLWRKAVFERDNYTCQATGQWGGKLVVHHINNFADFPELRTSISNGITLSDVSHREFHKKYGRRNNTMEQLQEFIKAMAKGRFGII